MAEAGLKLGRYTLRRRLGSGGAGEVWEAVLEGPAGFTRSVALKLLRDGPGLGGSFDALVQEARLGALLAHPNVVGVYELGEVLGSWYFAMELVRGPSVADLGKNRPLSARAILDIGVQTCAGLTHIHDLLVDGRRAGLVHRDIKRPNLLVDGSGLVKIADLGIARLAGSSRGPGGTPGYMAPEQVAGLEDARADLFSLGVLLYVLATGKRPFGTGMGALHTVLLADEVTAAPGFFAKVDARVPGLGDVVRRCLRAQPAERWSTAAELGAALAALVPGQAPGSGLLEALTPRDEGIGSTPFVGRGATLPRHSDAFVGRDDELRDLVAALNRGAVHLVSLVGPAGAGKSRLAVEVARAYAPQGSVGARWYADLSVARDPAALADTVARAMGLVGGGAVGSALGASSSPLLVLDNLDHLIEIGVDVIGRWMEQAPEARFLVTSRARFGIAEEHVHEVEPLSVQDAIALFGARCERTVDEEERPLIPDLVKRLDGLPLALELAAARARDASVAEVLAQLDRRLDWSQADPSVSLSRHQSLRASLDASWERLTNWERATLEQLSVFVDGFGVEAAEAVVELPPRAPWVVDALEGLLRQHLVRFDPDRERFEMLLAVRDHAAARILSDVRGRAEERHGRWFAQFGSREALDALRRRDAEPRFLAITADLENLVAAAERAIARGDRDVAPYAALAAAAVMARRGPFARAARLTRAAADVADARAVAWLVTYEGSALRMIGRVAEAQARIAYALELAGPLPDRRPLGALLQLAGVTSLLAGRPDEARVALDRSLGIAREIGDRGDEAAVTASLGMLERYVGDLAASERLLREALAMNLELGFGLAARNVRHNLAVNLSDQERTQEALVYQRDALREHRAAGDRLLESNALGNLGNLALMAGDLGTAKACLNQAIDLAKLLGDPRMVANRLARRADIRLAEGRVDQAREDLEEAVRLMRLVSDPRGEGHIRLGLAALFRTEGDLERATLELDSAEALIEATKGAQFYEALSEERAKLQASRKGGAP